MEGMIMTAQLLLSLSILIVVHEWGHYYAARTFNIRVEKFYLFFDFLFPLANVLNFSLLKIKRGDTEYGIGWFPLGGYVKIAGMVDESMDKQALTSTPQDWEFRAKKPWQRLIVMLGGVIVNVIVGVIIFICLTFFVGDTLIPKKYMENHGGIQALDLAAKLGLQTGDQIVKINGNDYQNFEDLARPDLLLSGNPSYTVIRNGQEIQIDIPANFIENFNSRNAATTFIAPRVPSVVGEVRSKSIAESAGIKPGDVFVEVDGQPVLYQDEVQAAIRGHKGDSISFKVKRGEEVMSFTKYFKGEEYIGYFPKGIDKAELSVKKYGIGESIVIGTTRAFGIVFVQAKAFWKIITGVIDFRKSLSGPVGMAKAFGPDWDWERFWQMTGLLSMVLAFMNLLPIPGLDGGYVAFLLYEMVTGREPNEKVFETALKIGMAILLALMVFVFYNDFTR